MLPPESPAPVLLLTGAVERAYDNITRINDYRHTAPIGMSMLGRCRRQAAYALRDGWPEENEPGSAQAYIGSAIHLDLLPRLAAQLGAQAEVPVVWDVGAVTVKGTADLVRSGTVIDLKTVSHYYYASCRERVPWAHLLQVTGYAAALKADTCALLYVNRSSGERFVYSWPAALHLPELVEWLADAQHPPEEVARDERGPGLSMVCDSCAWAAACWGPLQPAQQPQGAVVNEEGLEMALAEYAAARGREAAAKADREFWRQALVGSTGGSYGGWQLRWSAGGHREVLDVEMVRVLLEQAGYEVPMRRVDSGPTISVTPRKE